MRIWREWEGSCEGRYGPPGPYWDGQIFLSPLALPIPERVITVSAFLAVGTRRSTALPRGYFSRILGAMEVHFTPDVQAKLEQMARDTGRRSDELLEDAVVGLFDELAYTREMLDRRYDDLESGRVQPIDGEEAYRRLMEKTEAQRRHRGV